MKKNSGGLRSGEERVNLPRMADEKRWEELRVALSEHKRTTARRDVVGRE